MNKQFLNLGHKNSTNCFYKNNSTEASNNAMKNNSKKRGAVLPTVVISMVIISLFSMLIITFVLSSTLSSKLLINNSTTKLEYAKIYNDFKNDCLEIDENSNILVYSAYDISDKTTIANENIKAIIVKNNTKISLFGVYDFTIGLEKEIAFQTSKISIKLDADNNFEFNGYYFKHIDIAEE